MELTTLNALYLELSQFATAKTANELGADRRAEYLSGLNEDLRTRAEAAEDRVAELEAAIREHRRAVHKTQIEALGCIAPTDCDDVLWAHVAPVEE